MLFLIFQGRIRMLPIFGKQVKLSFLAFGAPHGNFNTHEVCLRGDVRYVANSPASYVVSIAYSPNDDAIICVSQAWNWGAGTQTISDLTFHLA